MNPQSLRATTLLSATFQLWRRGLPAAFVMVGLAELVRLAVDWIPALIAGELPFENHGATLNALLFFGITAPAAAVAIAGLMAQLAELARRAPRPAGMLWTLRQGMRVALRTYGFETLRILVMLAGILAFAAAYVVAPPLAVPVSAIVLGAILWVYSIWILAGPLIVLEHETIGRALGRSSALVRGRLKPVMLGAAAIWIPVVGLPVLINKLLLLGIARAGFGELGQVLIHGLPRTLESIFGLSLIVAYQVVVYRTIGDAKD